MTSVFINEYLPSATYKEFENLKSLAKKLEFKYIWHRRGQFFAKMRDGERVFTFSTPTDLQAIAASYKNENTEAIKNLTAAMLKYNVVMNSSVTETTAKAKNKSIKKRKSKKSKNNNNKEGSKDKDANFLDGVPTGKHVERKSGPQAGFINVHSLRAHIAQIRQFLSNNPSYDLLGIAHPAIWGAHPFQ